MGDDFEVNSSISMRDMLIINKYIQLKGFFILGENEHYTETGFTPIQETESFLQFCPI